MMHSRQKPGCRAGDGKGRIRSVPHFFVHHFLLGVSMLAAVGTIGPFSCPSARADTEPRPGPHAPAPGAPDSDNTAPPIEEILVTGRPIAQERTYQRPGLASTAAADSAALLRSLRERISLGSVRSRARPTIAG